MPSHKDRFGGFLLDLQFPHFFDEPFLRFGAKSLLNRQPIRIAPKRIRLGNTIQKIGLDLACEATKRSVADRSSRLVILTRL